MRVSKVWISKFNRGHFLGFVDITFSVDDSKDQHFTIKNFKLMDGDNGKWLALPSQKDEKGNLDDNGTPKYWPTMTVVRAKEDEPQTKGEKFLNYLKDEVVKAYDALGQQEQEQKKSQSQQRVDNTGNIDDDDIPF